MTSSTQHKRDKRLQPPANRGVARVFKGGGVRFFIEKGKVGSERSERCLRRWVPGVFVDFKHRVPTTVHSLPCLCALWLRPGASVPQANWCGSCLA